MPFAIFGSCVSRDPFQFCEDALVPLYCARQTLASSASPRASADFLSKIVFNQDVPAFHQRCIESDVGKTTLGKLKKLPRGLPVILDLIEERFPLGLTPENTLVTLSEGAQKFSNLTDLVVEELEPWSDQRLALFHESLPSLAAALQGHHVIIHRAVYAESVGRFPGINAKLRAMYDDLQAAIPSALAFEAPQEVLMSEPNHMWGPAPFHYIDAYYEAFLAGMEQLLKHKISRKPDFSLRRLKTAAS